MPIFEVRRGEIYFISLDPAFGSELAGFKMRPVVVVSVNDLHAKTQMVTVIPGTSRKEKHKNTFQNQVTVNRADVELSSGSRFGLDDQGNELTTVFDCNQIRAVSQGRLTQRSVGKTRGPVMSKIEDAMRYCLGLGMAPEA